MAILKDYLRRFWQYAGCQAVAIGCLSFLAGSLRGVGFLMILPFLQILGVADSGVPLPGFVQVVVDQWRVSPVPLNLTVALSGYVLLIALVALLGYGEKILQSRLSTGFVLQLRHDLFGHLMRAPWTYLARIRRAELLQNMQLDANQVQNAVNELMSAASTAVICLVYLVVALQLSPALTLVCAAVGLGIALLLRPLRRRIERAATRGRGAQVEMFRQIEERISMIKLIKSFAKEPDETREFQAQTTANRRSIMDIAKASALAPLGYSVVGAIGLSCVVAVAIGMLKIAPERVIVLVLVFSRLVPQIARLQESGNRISSMTPALNSLHAREQELATCGEAVVDANAAPLPLVREMEFRGVTYTYPGKDEPGVAPLNLRIPANRITALAGPSGAGKSTLADLALGLLPVQQGAIFVDSVPLAGEAVARWRQSTAYMPQEQLLFHDTIRANLKWAKPDATDEELWTALRQASAEDFVRNLPQHLDTIVGERGAQLSGGERQRLSLARALMRSPSLLVLDEPTSALDDENEAVIHEALQKLKDSTTVLLIAHRQSTLQVADRVIRLIDGRPADQPRQST